MSRPLAPMALLLLASGAFAQRTEADVRKVYARMNVLIAKRDANGLVALFERTSAPDFVSIMGGQRMSRKKFASDLRTGMSAKDAPTGTSRIVSAIRKGNTLILDVRWAMKGKGPDGKPFAMNLVSINTWVKTAKGYRLKKTEDRLK